MEIIEFKSELAPYFKSLNLAWIQKYFEVEPLDEIMLSNPEEYIIEKGGKIFFVEYNGDLVGTVALIKEGDGIYELAKMAVSEEYRGLGLGRKLCVHALNEAQKLNASKVILYTNSALKPAITLYLSLGFEYVQNESNDYKRADVKMEVYFNGKIVSNQI